MNKVGDLLVELVVEGAKTNPAAVKAATDSLNQVSQSASKMGAETVKAASKAGTGISNAMQSASSDSRGFFERMRTSAADSFMTLSRHADQVADKLTSMGTGVSKTGSNLTKYLTMPILGASGAAATLVGTLGFKRLVGIDTARGQFRGLGMDADAVMKQVDKGVTGTALSMADGAAAAVSILATGAVPLEGLEAQIKRVSNVAAAYGLEASQANYLLNLSLTKGKVTYGDLAQMQKNQIPIITALADHYGVAAEEIEKMAANGQISIEDLNTVLDDKAGKAAEEYAKTWEGVTANIRSNLGRIGAAALGSAFEIVKEKATEFLEVLRGDDLREWSTIAGEAIGNFLSDMIDKAQAAIEWWKGLSKETQGFILKGIGVAVAMGPVLQIFGKILIAAGGAARGISLLSKSMGLILKHPIVAGITLIVGALIWFFTQTELGQAIVEKVWEAIKTAISAVTDWWTNTAAPAFSAAWDAIKGAAQAVADWWTNTLIPAFTGAWDGVKAAWDAVGDWFDSSIVQPIKAGFESVTSWWTDNVQPVLAAGWDAISDAAGQFADWVNTHVVPVLEAFGELGEAIKERWLETWESIKAGFTAAAETITAGWDAFTGYLSAGWEAVKGAFQAFADWMMDFLQPVFDVISAGWDAFTGALSAAWESFTGALSAAWEATSAALSALWENLWNGITAVWQSIGENAMVMVEAAWENLKVVGEAIWNGIKGAIETALAMIKGIINSVTAAIRGDWKGAWNAIRGVWDTFWNGLRSAITNAMNTARTVFSNGWNAVRTVTTNLLNNLLGFIRNIPSQIMAGLSGLAQLGARAAQWFGQFLSSAVAKMGEVLSYMRNVPSKLLGALGNLGSLLVNAGRSLLEGLARGITQGFGKAIGAMTDGLKRLRSFLPFSPAKRGPFSGKGYTTHAGRKLMEDFGIGLTEGNKKVLDAGDKALRALQGKLSAGAKKAAQASVKAAEELDKKYADLVKKIQTMQVNVAKVLSSSFWGAMAGTAKQANDALSKIIAEVNKIGLPKTNALATYLEAERKNVTKILAERELVSKRITDANKSLENLLKQQQSFVEKMRDSTADMSGALQQESAEDMIQTMRDQVAATKKFRADMDTLLRMGLSKNLVQQIAESGLGKGGATAAALVAGGSKAVKEMNVLEGQLARESQSLAKKLGDELYGAGINGAKGLIAGLQSQHAALTAEAQKIAVAIHREIKKELGIHSPSRVLRAIGSDAGEGLHLGLAEQVKATMAAAKKLASAAIPEVAPIDVSPLAVRARQIVTDARTTASRATPPVQWRAKEAQAQHYREGDMQINSVTFEVHADDLDDMHKVYKSLAGLKRSLRHGTTRARNSASVMAGERF